MAYSPKSAFKPGQSGNPRGYRPATKEVKAIRLMRDEYLVTQLYKMGTETKPVLQAIIKNPESIMFDVMFAKCWLQAGDGNDRARQVIVERLWGKVSDQVAVDVKTTLKDSMADMPTEDLVKLAQGA